MVAETGTLGTTETRSGAAGTGVQGPERGVRGGDQQGFPPASEPIEPVAPAPARFGTAGISAGEDARFKETVTISPWKRMVAQRPGKTIRATNRDLWEAGEGGEWVGPTTDTVTRGLGWFSIGLGLAEIFAGRELAERLGMEDKTGLIRAYGVREIVKGVGILSQENAKGATPWVWGRVAGDALDLATLGAGLSRENPRRENVALAMAMVAGVTALDLWCATRLSGSR